MRKHTVFKQLVETHCNYLSEMSSKPKDWVERLSWQGRFIEQQVTENRNVQSIIDFTRNLLWLSTPFLNFFWALHIMLPEKSFKQITWSNLISLILGIAPKHLALLSVQNNKTLQPRSSRYIKRQPYLSKYSHILGGEPSPINIKPLTVFIPPITSNTLSFTLTLSFPHSPYHPRPWTLHRCLTISRSKTIKYYWFCIAMTQGEMYRLSSLLSISPSLLP